METKYDVEIPKTREETLAESTFEWVKTEKAGDVVKFKNLVEEGGVEYIVFQDGTRVNSALIGDVVLQHKYPDEVLGPALNPSNREKTPEEIFGTVKETPKPQPAIAPSNGLTTAQASPAISILEKSKKKKKKISFDFMMELPSAEILNIVKENFEASDEDLFYYFLSKIDKKKFVSAVISSVTDK